MDDPQKSEAFYQMIQNLAILSKPQNLQLSNQKLDMDLDSFEPQDLQPTRSNSDCGFLKKRLLKENSIRNHPKFKKCPEESSKVKLKALHTDDDSDSNSNQSRKWSYSQSSLLSSQIFPADLDVENFRTRPQTNKFHYMTIDTDGLQSKESPKAKPNNSSNKPLLSEKERLVELINLANEENFELRKSNVKFQQQRRLQILKVRDLKFKISQQNQKISQQKAEEKAISNLENVIRAKQLEILSLKYQIKSLNEKLFGKCLTEAEMRPKKTMVKSVKREHRRSKSMALARDPAKHGDIQTLASKLNQFLAQMAQLKENTVNQLQFFQQQ